MRSTYVLCLLLPFLLGCSTEPASNTPGNNNSQGTSTSSRDSASAGPGPAAGEWFVDRAHETGLDFVHFNGMTGKFYQPEIMAPGVALFDYDNDGDLDVYLVQGQLLGSGTPLLPLQGPPGDRLYRNDLEVKADGTRVLHFTDVTAQSGIHPRGYGMGVAVGDIDNDGWPDLYLTGFGRNQMYRNNGNGTFSDITKASGTDDGSSWGVSATFFDYDREVCSISSLATT